MQQPILNLLKDNSLYIAIVVTIAIAYLSLMETGPTIVNISQIDKVEHAFAYAVLTVSWLLFFSKKKITTLSVILVVVGCIFYGILLEVLQATITLYRTLEFLDMLANSTGVFIGVLVFNQIFKKI